MASGFDQRQPTRNTFAFQPPAAGQASIDASGQSRGAQLVGGQSTGGVVTSGPQTDAGPVATSLGTFVDQIMQPHIEARQQEQFFKGFTEAQSGIALDQIDKGNSPMRTIFGPTGFEQGAEFFTAKSKLDKWSQARMAEMDDLKRMTPEDAAKVVSQTSKDLMTGNPGVDQMLQSSLVAASAPLLNTVAKARYGYQQEQASHAWTDAAGSSATTLQALASTQARLDPAQQDNSVIGNSVRTFLGGMVKPHGMDDETYKKGLMGFMQDSMQQGNFYAVEAMRRAGIDKVFDDADQVKLQTAYEKFGHKVLGRAAMEASPALIDLDVAIKRGEVSAKQAAGRLAGINNQLKATTGVDIDLFDSSDIRHAAGDAVNAVLAAEQRLKERAWQLEDRNQARAWALQDRADEEAKNSAQVHALWGMGAVKSGIAGGMKAGDFDIMAINDYRSGNVSNIANAYAREGWVSGDTSSLMQAKVTSTIGQGYSKDFATSYSEWQKLNAANPAAASAYYGKYAVPMKNFDSLQRGGLTPQLAYVRAFGDPATYSVNRVPPQMRKEVEGAVRSVVAAHEPWTIPLVGWGVNGTPLNASSTRALTAGLTDQVAVAANNSDVSPTQLAKEGYEAMFKAGKAEKYGEYAWRTPAGTVAMGTLLKLQPKEADTVVSTVIKQRMAAAGVTDNGDGPDITRIKDERGRPAIIVQGHGENGYQTPVVIKLADFDKEARHRRADEVADNQPNPGVFAAKKAVAQGLDPYRHVPGETGWQQQVRINREVAAGADPVNHGNHHK